VSDDDFEERYPRNGKPGLSPARLATISVLQFLLELSDRQAAESVRNRIGFEYALGMELEDPGFHHSVLADFRERLAEENRADKLLDLALEKTRAVGLLRERGRQHTDSTHVLTTVRDLTRLLRFSLVPWGWVDGESGVGEEGPGKLIILADAVDASFGGVGNVCEVVADEVGELTRLDRRPQQLHRIQLGCVGR